MTCREFEKYLYAFADGELDLRTNLEALEHLNLCPRCCDRVNVQVELRSALRRIHSEPLPQGLESRVREALAHASRAADSPHKPTERVALAVRAGRRWALAASIVLAAGLAWAGWTVWRPSQSGGDVLQAADSELARELIAQHVECAAQGAAHQAPGLPRDLREVRRIMSRRLGIPVLGPDLTSRDLLWESAGYCRVGRETGAHLIYREVRERLPVSLFSVRRIPGVPECYHHNIDHYDWYIIADEPDMSVILWHSGRASYIVCGDMPRDQLLRIAEPVRLALAKERLPGWPVLAALGR